MCLVPLRKIELRYQLTDGTNNTLHTGQNIRFQRDLVRSVSCHVSVTGSDFGPEVVLMLDATDVTSLFEKRVVRGYGDSGGFVEAANSAEFKWIFDGNDGTWVEKVHGRNLTCIATMSMFPPIAASALVEAERKFNRKAIISVCKCIAIHYKCIQYFIVLDCTSDQGRCQKNLRADGG